MFNVSCKNLAKLYKTLAHPARLHLLYVLTQQEACVCHLTCLLEKPQPYISQQLGVLREAGLLSDRRDGQIIYYRVSAPMVLEMIAQGQHILQEQGIAADMPILEAQPLPGCPCPKCQELSMSCCDSTR